MKPRVLRFSHLWFGVVFAMVAAAIPLGGAVANHTPNSYRSLPDQTVTPITTPSITWTGTQATGANAQYNFNTGEPCHHPNPLTDPDPQKCDIFLLNIDLSEDPGYWADKGGGVLVSIGNYTPNPGSDFDLQCWRADAAGQRTNIRTCSSGNNPAQPEQALIPPADATGYHLIQVVYFAVTNSTYTGNVKFAPRSPFPPDVDSPPGFQDILASDPSEGFRSYSEPHIAQNPVNPSMLIAGSKFYNKDPQSLAEYEFKIGSFVSFDRGRTWTSLGQLGVCPVTDPGAWKPVPPGQTNHTCYPEEDPAANDEYAEEYITSDIWMQWDDEGNAYAMVLDSPPYASGLGWGMTLHKWESVSEADLVSGDTWSDRIPINFYPSEPIPQQDVFLDDKNTLAVNNAGPDMNGVTGPIVACWGLNIDPLIKQQQTCKLSTDGGMTWPDTSERPISGADQLNIGSHVVADPFDEGTFYAVYLRYDTTIPGDPAPAFMDFNKTINADLGGLAWSWLPAPTVITPIDDIPRQFPGQGFRNLSLPIMAAGLQRGTPPMTELYATWAEERPIGSGGLKEADVVLVRSDDAGLTWTGLGPANAPAKVVNGPDNDRDQFQPYVVVNPAGQVEVMYFDRRHDPSNFFVDTFLSRSKDRGATFTDLRLSHDATSPEFNAPVSGSGLFFGDYQGLVADNCFTIPFVNDTHLANDAFLDPGPERDPDYDAGMPDSEFQQAISWRIPNILQLGGGLRTRNCTSRRGSIPT